MTVLIPTYNGAHLLGRYLPGVLEAVRDAEVIVIDDGSDDGSVEMVKREFSSVSVIARSRNGGFSQAVNDGIRAASGDFVMVLNNDVEVTVGFLDTLVSRMKDESVFAVTPRIVLPSRGNVDEGAKTARWHHGILYTGQMQDAGSGVPVLYATGCAALYRKSMLDELGGFDEAYSPFYWEDLDLCYRAWKRGWKTVYEAESLVYHQHSASISRWPRAYADTIKARNSLLFIWRNIEDGSLLKKHRYWLPLVLARRLVTGDTTFVLGWKEAWRVKKQAFAAREVDSRHRIISDREILEIVGVKC